MTHADQTARGYADWPGFRLIVKSCSVISVECWLMVILLEIVLLNCVPYKV